MRPVIIVPEVGDGLGITKVESRVTNTADLDRVVQELTIF